MRHQEPELHKVEKPGVLSQLEDWVLAGFESQPRGFKSESEVHGFTSTAEALALSSALPYRC